MRWLPIRKPKSSKEKQEELYSFMAKCSHLEKHLKDPTVMIRFEESELKLQGVIRENMRLHDNLAHKNHEIDSWKSSFTRIEASMNEKIIEFETINNELRSEIEGWKQKYSDLEKKLDFKDDLPIYDFEDISKLFKASSIEVFVAIGPNKTNSVRERLCKDVLSLGYKLIKYVHPSAHVWNEEVIGYNSFIFPNCIVEPFAEVGNNCVMWSGSILAHHSCLCDNVFMAPGAKISGRTIIKRNCFIGINSTIRDNIVVEENCIIGAGAIIKKSTIKNGVYSSTGTLLHNQNSFETKV